MGRLPFLRCRTARLAWPVEAAHALVIDTGELRAQQLVDTPVAKATTRTGDLHDLLVQFHGGLISLWRVAVAVAREPHKTARTAFGQTVFADYVPNCLTPGPRG